MKELIKKSIEDIKRNGQIWFLAITVFSFIMAIASSLVRLIGMLDLLLIFFIVCPFIFSFINIAFKIVNNEEIEYKDIYSGYKGLNNNLGYILKRMLKPILLFFFLYFILYLVIAFINLMFFNYSIIEELMVQFANGASSNDLSIYLLNDTSYLENIKLSNYIAIGLTFILLNIFMNKKILSMAFFSRVKVHRLNYDYIISKRESLKNYKTIFFDLLCALFIAVGLVLAIVIYTFLNNILSNVLLSYSIASLVFYLIYGLSIPLKYGLYINLFNNLFRNDIELLKNEKD